MLNANWHNFALHEISYWNNVKSTDSVVGKSIRANGSNVKAKSFSSSPCLSRLEERSIKKKM